MSLFATKNRADDTSRGFLNISTRVRNKSASTLERCSFGCLLIILSTIGWRPTSQSSLVALRNASEPCRRQCVPESYIKGFTTGLRCTLNSLSHHLSQSQAICQSLRYLAACLTVRITVSVLTCTVLFLHLSIVVFSPLGHLRSQSLASYTRMHVLWQSRMAILGSPRRGELEAH